MDRQAFSDEAIEHGASLGAIGKNHLRPDPVANMIDPNWVKDPKPDRNKHQLVVPRFDGHPCPPAAQFLFVAARRAPCPPPWRVRVSAKCCATYSMALIARALSPHATIVITPDGRSPAPQFYPALLNQIEFDPRDQNLPPDRNYDPAGVLWTPPQRTR